MSATVEERNRARVVNGTMALTRIREAEHLLDNAVTDLINMDDTTPDPADGGAKRARQRRLRITETLHRTKMDVSKVEELVQKLLMRCP